ncbi:MAG TPA: hypothetical protein QF874_01290 [Pelagibacteraceae bacterium]|jgi:hypothetical protein|nr:hypothetical protein [Pelagibacteraceae bacterium]|tara:strand:- start:703 stop:873 length:171 start_codon:yes stop_codon:yes gene_type:complete
MNNNKQLKKGGKMKKAILSLLVVLSLSAAVTAPAHAYWVQKPWGGIYWCNSLGQCR